MAGAIAHGCGLSRSVMQHYVSPLAILESAMLRVQVPASMRGLAEESSEDVLLSSFRKMDDAARSLLLGMSDRLAAG